MKKQTQYWLEMEFIGSKWNFSVVLCGVIEGLAAAAFGLAKIQGKA